jgi:hypothetical protein
MLHATDFDKQRALMRQYETRIIDTEAREFPMLWWNRMIPERSFVDGWKIGPSHFINQDLSNIWLDEGRAGKLTGLEADVADTVARWCR